MKKIFIFTFLFVFTLSSYSLAFGPSNSKLYNGIDVSEWQRDIDFQKVKEAGIQIVYIKSSQGNDYIDPYFERNYKNAKDNGLKIGVYHFLTARTIEEAKDEADFFASVISNKQIDCRLAMDFEVFRDLTKEEIDEFSKAFLERVSEITKKEMVIYSDASNARDVFDEELAKKYPIWVAEYGTEEPFNNGKWNTWVGFQYADNGRINGITGYVDKDYYTEEIFLSNTSEVPKTEHRNNADKTKNIRVKRGDTLARLAVEYKTSITELVELNNIRNRNLIYVGEILKVPYLPRENRGETNHIIYTIKRGDTLTKIAREFNVTVRALARLNEIRNINLIYAGEVLRIEIK